MRSSERQQAPADSDQHPSARQNDSAERHFLSATHYSTNAFFRHQLGDRFTQAQLGQTLYPTFAAARQGAASDRPERSYGPDRP
jgi:hypothetical protein